MRSLPGWSRFLEVYCAAIFLVYVLVIFGHDAVPSLTDYANWTYQGVLLHDHLLGVPDAAHALKRYPVPNSAATVGIGLLCLLMSWQMAAKVWLAMQLVLAWASLYFFLRAADLPKSAIVVGTVLFLNLNLWEGFVNFQMGLSWVLVIAALLLRRPEDRPTPVRQEFLIGFFLMLTFFTHMLPFMFAGMLVVLWCFQKRSFRLLWQLIPSGLACVWYVAGRYLLGANADGQAGLMAESVRNYSAAFLAFKGNSYLKSLGFVNPTYSGHSALFAWAGETGFVFLLGLDLVIAIAVAGCSSSVLRRLFVQKKSEQFLWLGVVILLPLYLVAPVSFLGISDPGARLLQLSLVLAVLLSARSQSKGFAVAQGCALVLMTVDLAMFPYFAYGPEQPTKKVSTLPCPVLSVAHVSNHDQDSLLRALGRGDRTEPVFVTGIFLNKSK